MATALQFAKLPDINDVQPLAEADAACLEEVANVFRKYGNLDRFGVSLLHKHFPVAEDEMLVESCDPVTRTLTTRPVPKGELEGLQYTTTSWHLGTGKPQMACVCVRMGNDHQHHSRG